MAKEKVESALPQKVFKGNRTFDHDLFKLEIAKAVRNESWQYRHPRMLSFEHVHFFHSMNDRTGKPNTHCSPVGGHVHELKVDWSKKETNTFKDEFGKTQTYEGPKVECGPPLALKKIRSARGTSMKKLVPVKFIQHADIGPDIVDTHTHRVTYLETEEMSLQARNEKRAEEKKRVAGMLQHSMSQEKSQPEKMTELQDLEKAHPGLLEEKE